jgi:F0F1-type ATP synthase assembly protein I
MFTKIRHQAHKVLFFQLTIVLLLAVVVLFVKDAPSGFSVFSGGLAYIVPSLLFITKIFSSKLKRLPSKIFIDFYCGELIKLILSFLLLLLLFNFIPVNIIYILLGYGAASLSLLFLPVAF